MPTYQEMVHHALHYLHEKGNKGSTRQELWKCVHAQNPAVANEKMFFARLKKLTDDKLNGIEHPNGNKARFRLTQSFLDKLVRRVTKGQSIKIAAKNIMTMKPMKMAQSERKKKAVKKAVKKATGKKNSSANKKSPKVKNPAKSKNSGKKEGKGKPAKMTAKEQMKSKAKLNKKTEGSAKVQQKKTEKKKMNKDKAKLSKTKN